MHKVNIARAMLVGDVMHGKTALCRDVTQEQRTRGLEIHDLGFPPWRRLQDDGLPLTIKLWGFAVRDV